MFRWRKQVFRIEHADGPERIAPEWWNDRLGLLETEPENEESRTTPIIPVQENAAITIALRTAEAGASGSIGTASTAGTKPSWYVHGVFG